MFAKKSILGAIAVLAVAAMIVAGAISASSGDAGRHGANGIVGSWEATVDRGPAFPPLVTLHTFTGDGSIVETGSDTMFRSPAIGTWEYVGDRTFATTMVMHRFSPAGVYLGTGRINANRRLSQDGEYVHGGGRAGAPRPSRERARQRPALDRDRQADRGRADPGSAVAQQ